MRGKKRLTFSTEFKLASALLVVGQQYSVREVALAVGVGHSTMDKWVRQLHNQGQVVTLKQSAMTPEHRRIKELEKKLLRIEEHNEISKKATALLMSDSLNS